MDEKNRGGSLADDRLEYFPGVYDAGIKAPLGDLDLPKNPVLAVEQQSEENFLLAIAQTFVEMGKNLAGTGEAASGREGGCCEAARQLTESQDFRGLGRADAGHFTEFGRCRRRHGA